MPSYKKPVSARKRANIDHYRKVSREQSWRAQRQNPLLWILTTSRINDLLAKVSCRYQ